MANLPSLLSDNWFLFTGSGGIVIFVASLGAMGIITGDDPAYLIWLLYIGLGLFLVAILLWGLYNVLRRFGIGNPDPIDMRQLESDVSVVQDQLDDIDGIDDRVSELERKLREMKLNEADKVVVKNEVNIQQ